MMVKKSTLVLLVVILNITDFISLVTSNESDVTSGQPQQITTITTSSSEPCSFNRFCTCVTENIQSITPQIDSLVDTTLENNNTDDLLNSFNIDQQTNTIYSHSKLFEITCLNSPFFTIPKLPSGSLYRLNLIGCKQLSRIKSSSFIQTQISSITISRSKVQIIDNDAFLGSQSTLTALDLSLNELSKFPSNALTKLPFLQWLSLKGNRIEEIRASDLFPQQNKESNGKFRVRRSSNKHHRKSSNKQRSNVKHNFRNSSRYNSRSSTKYSSNRYNPKNFGNKKLTKNKNRRVRRDEETEYKIPVKADWIVTKKEHELKPEDQILLMRTSRKRHYHRHTKQHKSRNRVFRDKEIDESKNAYRNYQNSSFNQKIDDDYQNDDYQVLREETQENDQYSNQTEPIDHGVLSLRSLLLSDNYLTTITGQTFASLSNLEAIDLDNNLIYKIDGKPFPTSLGSLSLANNLLEKFPVNSIKILKQLKWLQLRGNMLKNLPEEWPFSTNQIEILDLSRNLISSLNGFLSIGHQQKQVRSKITLYAKNESIKQNQQNSSQQLIIIKDLLLDGNLLRNLPDDTFTNCQIERLILSNNRLNTLTPGLFLNSPLSNNLKILDLSNNQLEQLNNSLVGLKKLQTLLIRNNQLDSLNENTFKTNAETLQILDLSGNRFSKVPYQSFEPIKRLLKLNLQNNQLKSLTKSDFQQWSKSLLSILLNKNQIEQIDRDTFKYCVNLRELRLASNKLYNVDSELFAPLGRKLSILELSDSVSDFIETEEESLFDYENHESSTNLSTLIKDGINKLKNIEFLELNHNSLKEISSSSVNALSNLVHIDLEGNELEDLGNGSLFNATKHSKLRNIILTNNKLERIRSFAFVNLRQIINIAVIGNQLRTIESNAFFDLPQLSTILLSRNQLRTIKTSAFNSLKNLRNLFLQHNQLEDLSLDMFNDSNLLVRNKMMLNDEEPRQLNLAYNPTINKLNLQNSQQFNGQSSTTIQSNYKIFTGLHLNVSHNRIKQLNGLTKLRSNLKSNKPDNQTSLNEIESEEEYQLNLSVLDLSFNQLTKLNSQFFQVVGKNLIKLIVDHNQLSSFPVDSLNQCPNLQLVSLRNNKIQDLKNNLDLSIVDYSSLQVLDLSYNEISNLKSSFKSIFSTAAKLIYLDLSNNRINNLSDNIFNGTSIQHLDLSSNQLNDLPFTLNCYGVKDSLVSLILDSNQLSSLPKELNTCINLNYLSIRSNQLTEIGSLAFVKLAYLLHLDLSSNTFYSIQNDAFDKLNNLRKLYLNSCNLDSLPSLNDCDELIELDLSNNSFTLPVLQQPFNAFSKFNSITKCRKLKVLNLSSNQLNEVPRQLWKYLNSITELDLSSNPIELLDSSSLAELKNLRVIDIRNLQLKYVDSRVFHSHKHLTYIKTSTYPNVRSFRLYDLLAKMFSVRRALIHVEEPVLSHQIQWAFGSKIKELTITGQNLNRILPDAFLGLYHTPEFVLRITKTNITELPEGLLRYLTISDLKYVTIDLSDNKLTSLNRNVLFFGKEKKNNQFTAGAIQVQKNNFRCDCNILWLKNWLERWLRESRKAQLVSHEHYLRNYQLIEQITCTEQFKSIKRNQLESPIKLDFFKILPKKFERLTGHTLIESSSANRTNIDQEINLFKLNENYLKCSNSVISLNRLTYRLIDTILIIWIVLISCQSHYL